MPLSGVQEVENSLKEAKERATSEAEITRVRLRQLEDAMNKSLGIAGELTEASLVKVTSDSLVEVGHPPISSLEEIGGAVRSLDQELAKFGDTAIPGRLLRAISSVRELLDEISPGSFTRLLATTKTLRDKEAAEAKVFYDRVLDDGIKWIREENRRACPLCEQPIDAAATIASAQARLDSMRELIDLRRQASASLSEAISTVRSMKDSAARAKKALTELGIPDLNISTLSVDGFSTKLVSLEGEIAKGLKSLQLETVESSIIFLQDGSSEKASLAESVSRLQQALNALPSPNRATQLLSTRQRITRAWEGWNQIQFAEVSYDAATTKATVAETVYQHTLEVRKEVVQEIFDKLSAEIDRLYNRLHPDESHGGIRLEVREAGQASANLRASFYERTNEDPRAYYSDAHLDTLGISIFLALRKWHRQLHPEFNLLVLDDVLTSIDNAHAVRLSELLLNDFSDYQVLLTTHDRIWYEHFIDIQARCGVSANYTNKVIHKWTIEEGPDLREPEDERELLKELLTVNRSAGLITSTAGRLLEHILQEMRYSLSLSVRAKRSERYEIGELWPPFYKAVRKNYVTFYAQVRGVLDALDLNWVIRNWVGGHFNDWAKRASNDEAVEFGQAVAKLFDAVFCPQCRKFITPSNTPIGQLSCPHGELIYPAPGRKEGVVVDRIGLAKQLDGTLRDASFDTNMYFEQKRAESLREQ